MLTKFSLLVFFLFVFNLSLVTARPSRWNAQRRAADPELLDTNAKRFAAGLPPLPPGRRWLPDPVESGKKPRVSHYYQP